MNIVKKIALEILEFIEALVSLIVELVGGN